MSLKISNLQQNNLYLLRIKGSGLCPAVYYGTTNNICRCSIYGSSCFIPTDGLTSGDYEFIKKLHCVSEEYLYLKRTGHTLSIGDVFTISRLDIGANRLRIPYSDQDYKSLMYYELEVTNLGIFDFYTIEVQLSTGKKLALNLMMVDNIEKVRKAS